MRYGLKIPIYSVIQILASGLILITGEFVQESPSDTEVSPQARNRRQGYLTSMLSRFNSGLDIFMNSAGEELVEKSN